MHEWFEEHNHPFLMKGVTPGSCRTNQALCEDCYDFTPDRDNYEYVYLTQSLINLSGKKFRQKKNNLNHFRNQYIGNWEYVPITEDIFDECLEAEKTWYNQHEDGDDDNELLGERHAIETVFNNWSVLQPTGGAIRMYNKIVAFFYR